jgi:hypothetical protein
LEEVAQYIGKAATASYRNYFDEEGREQLRAGYERVAQRWIDLQNKLSVFLADDPVDYESNRARALGLECVPLFEEQTSSDPALKAAAIVAGLNTPAWRVRREPMSRFIDRVLEGPLRKHFTEDAWAKRLALVQQRTVSEMRTVLESRVELFRDVESLLGESPGSGPVKILAVRWNELRHYEAGGDGEILAGSWQAWADRRNWPIALKFKEACTYGMAVEAWERAAHFLDQVTFANTAVL